MGVLRKAIISWAETKTTKKHVVRMRLSNIQNHLHVIQVAQSIWTGFQVF